MFRERQTTVSRRLLTNLANSFRQPGAFLVASNESRTSSRLPITSAMAAPPVKSSSKGKAAKPDLRKRKTGKKGGEDPTPELPKETAEVRVAGSGGSRDTQRTRVLVRHLASSPSKSVQHRRRRLTPRTHPNLSPGARRSQEIREGHA